MRDVTGRNCVKQPHETKFVLYIVYEGQRSVPMAWSDNREYVETQEVYLQSLGHKTEIAENS